MNAIQKFNLAYLMLAQHLIRSDREAAIFRLGISEEIADILDNLTPGQVGMMATDAVDAPICRLRFTAKIVQKMASHQSQRGVGHIHAAILAARLPVESIG